MSSAMEIKSSSARHFAPIGRAIFFVGALGLFAGLIVATSQGNSPATAVQPSSVTPIDISEPSHTYKLPSLWTNWRWASEDGVYFIEYTWKPRPRATERRPSAIMQAS